MRRVVVLLVFLAAQTTSLGDEVVRTNPATGSAHLATPSIATISFARAHATRELSSPTLDRSLMILLAVAAVGFQLRRKYKTSLRIWQQRSIDDPNEFRLSAATQPPAPYGMSSTVRWQQIH